MSVMLDTYYTSNPSSAAQAMTNLRKQGTVCPMCGRVAKWVYTCYESTSQKDKPYRCAMHEISPIPGPSYYSDEEKVRQLY